MLINYLPKFLKEIEEYQELFKSLDIEVNSFENEINYVINLASILNADEIRISEWEAFLKIEKKGNLYQRKLYILAALRSVGKLNEKKIQDIVNIYTNGGGAIVLVENSNIIIKVKPPEQGETFLFPDIERTILVMKPAHLGLIVARYYSTYAIISQDFKDYKDLINIFSTYQKLKNYIKE